MPGQELRDSSGEKQWKAQSAAWRGSLEVTQNFSPWTQHRAFKGLGVPRNKRVYGLVDCCWMQACKRKRLRLNHTLTEEGLKAGVHKGLFVDISQNHIRRPWADSASGLRTLTTSTKLYHFGSDRMLVGKEYLMFQGYGTDVCPANLSDNDLKNLAGEGICLPCLGHVLWCAHLIKNLTHLRA